MKRNPLAAFTMVEMMVVMTIIVILAGLVAGVAGYAQRKGYRARSEGEIQMLSSACENYRVDNGAYPREIPTVGTGVTDQLQPKTHFLPKTTNKAMYTQASLFLYKELSGERSPDGAGGVFYNQPDPGAKRYLKDMEPRILKVKKNAVTKAIEAAYYFQDPFGNSYGYSTAAAAIEQDFERSLKQGTTATEYPAGRPSGAVVPGFNIGSFDIWSTSGSAISVVPPTVPEKDLEWSKWVKNW